VPTDAEVKKIIELYRRHLNRSLADLLRFMGFEAIEVRGQGATVYDTAGNEYIDCLAGFGALSMGHAPQPIVDAVVDQAQKLPLSTRLLFSAPEAELAAQLARITPGDLQYTFFCNSGAEAVEGALKLARFHTKRTKIVGAIGGFHGKTFGALSASGRDVYKAPFQPLVPDFAHVPYGDIEALDRAVDERTAAVILEPIQGEAGVIIPPQGYLRQARELCTERGALLILDEVQTGMGRTGKNFAAEHEGVVPDIMTLGKALGGGVMPIGAFVGTPAVWTMFDENPLLHSSTFGGNPLACRAGLAAIDMLERENLAARAAELGGYFLAKLRQLARRYPQLIEEVRGRGLLIGVSFADADVGGMVIAALAARRVLAAYMLNNPKVVRFEPPLTIAREEIDQVLLRFAEALEQTAHTLAELGIEVPGETE